jgi:cysteine synthase A
LRLRRFAAGERADIFAKLELMSPGGSVKDRLGVGLIEGAEKRGDLLPGGTIVEPTAGNTGIALALVGVQRGYRVILTVPENFSVEKVKLMEALGGEVVRTPDALGMQGAIDRAQEIAAELGDGAYVPNQFWNDDNSEVHYRTTAPEIWEQMEGRVDAAVIGVGSSGSFMGVSRFLKEKNPDVCCVVVEPNGSILQGGEPGPHKVEGIGVSFIPGIFDHDLVDEIMMVHDDDALATVRAVARSESLLIGGSAGANVHAALQIARRLGPGKRVVTIVPDSAERYISKGVLDG